MTRAEIAANARKPYADAIARIEAQKRELLEALEAVLMGFDSGEFKRTKARQADSDPYHPVLVQARAVIARVKGK